MALQESAESYLVDLFGDTNLEARSGNALPRVYFKPELGFDSRETGPDLRPDVHGYVATLLGAS